MMFSMQKSTLVMAWILSWLAGGSSFCSAQGRKQDSKMVTATTTSTGKKTFASTCAGCHGLDGRGSERAPNIASSPKVHRLSDSQLSNIISNGISGTGMPAFHTLSGAQVRSVVSYVRTLQGNGEARILPGNPGRGQEIFFGKGECSSCHAITGKGGFIGPDLTVYASTFSAEAILDAIGNPKRNVPAGYRSAVATTNDGARLEGILRNEDNFSIQLQGTDGSFHFLKKSDLQKLEYVSQPLMPTNYRERLTHDELNDLVSYLMDASSSRNPTPKNKGEDGEWIE